MNLKINYNELLTLKRLIEIEITNRGNHWPKKLLKHLQDLELRISELIKENK